MIGREIDRQRSMSNKLSTILDAVTAGAFLVDATGRLDFANETGTALLREGALLKLQAGALTAVDRPRTAPSEPLSPPPPSVTTLSLGSGAPSIVLTTRSGERFLAHVLPLSSGARRKASLGYSATAAIFVRRAEIPLVSGVEAVAKVHKLTPSEVQGAAGGGPWRQRPRDRRCAGRVIRDREDAPRLDLPQDRRPPPLRSRQADRVIREPTLTRCEPITRSGPGVALPQGRHSGQRSTSPYTRGRFEGDGRTPS